MIHHVIYRRDVGIVPDRVAAAVLSAISEAVVTGVRFPCYPITAECYPEGAVLHGSCGHTTFFRLILLPASLSIHERDFTHRWGSRQTVPIRDKGSERN